MIPRATYRLQLGPRFGFAAATALVPYLKALGISHLYLSPYLKARADSPHGYDIVDHNDINHELGSWEDFSALMAALRSHGMGHLLDLVINHMGVGGGDNVWWLDVLEHGRASRYAEFFDINWHPPRPSLRGRVLTPFLEDHYGQVLERGELHLGFDREHGALTVSYGVHRFPLDPRTYPTVLARRLGRLERLLGSADPHLLEFRTLLTALRHLPPRTATSPERVEERGSSTQVLKRRLAELLAACPEIGEHLSANVEAFNGHPGEPASFDPLHRLLEEQAYRLAYWRVASDEINYRRFFDVNDLAALRMEDPKVFAATHGLVLELLRRGQLDGLRLDHPDGLHDPLGYYRQLRAALGQQGPDTAPVYLVAEKILAAGETLPADWPLNGTTGYEFANEVNGLFVRPQAERTIGRVYRRFTHRTAGFEETLYEARRLAIEVQLFAELATLGDRLDRLAQRERGTRDFTANSLRNALKEVVACFPVYRTYIREDSVGEQDRYYVETAVARARRRHPAAETSVFDFIRDLLLNGPHDPDPQHRAEALDFVMCFQQYTAPVAAKALEDTSLYVDSRLLSLNEVGGDPRRFGISLEAFHRAAVERRRRWPATLLAGSTHDTKRSEDVRARLNVLSELPDEWDSRLRRWSRLNRRHRRQLEGSDAPSRNDEYLLYQTLLGTWQHGAATADGLENYRRRIQRYMLKAVREAKQHTSWVNPNAAYEQAVTDFAALLLDAPDTPFLADFSPFAERIAHFGYLNGLSQTLLRLTTPGVPDIYQGCELWNFSLVDPDNRREVDFSLRQRLLGELARRADTGLADLAGELAAHPGDGRAKMFLVLRLLGLRARRPALFAEGSYLPLAVEGVRAKHLCAFARVHAGAAIVVAAPRWFVDLADGAASPVGETAWGDTRVLLPGELAAREWTNILDGQTRLDAGTLPAATLMPVFPAGVALAGAPPA